MKMTEDDKRLIDIVRKLESKQCKDNLLSYGLAMVQAQEALKVDYGLVGLDAPLFNGSDVPAIKTA